MMAEIIAVTGLEGWFADRLRGLSYRPETLAYVAGVMKALGHPREGDDMSRRSVVLAYAEARRTGDFVTYQRIGDWVLWADALVPESIAAEKDAVLTLGRLSYYACYRLMRYKWDVYEELADDLPRITARVRRAIV